MEVDSRRKHRDGGFDGKGAKEGQRREKAERQSVWENNRDPRAHILDKERAVKKHVKT